MPRTNQDRVLDEHLLALIRQGNHDALDELRKRYHKHSLHLVHQLLTQYPNTGITTKELLAVCDSHFNFVIIKFNNLMPSSFLTFWKESTKNEAMDYLIENSYNGGAISFRGIISFNEANDDSLSYSEMIAERNENLNTNKKIFELRTQLYHFKPYFTNQEFSIVNLILVGYSFAELEHSGMTVRSNLYLTFKNAAKKLQKLINDDPENSK